MAHRKRKIERQPRRERKAKGKGKGTDFPGRKKKRDSDKAAESRKSICNNNKLFTARELASKQALTFRGGHEHGLGKWTRSF